MSDNYSEPLQCVRHGNSRGVNIPAKYFTIEESLGKGNIVAFKMVHFKGGEIRLVPIREEKKNK